MKRSIISAVAIFLILSGPLALLAQDTTGKKNPAKIDISSGNFLILTPAFLKDYAQQLLSPLEKGQENMKLEIVSSDPSEIFDLFEKGEGTIAFAVKQFSEKRPDKKIEVLKNPPGGKILSIKIGRTGFIILTHISNPLKGLTISQADAIFSSTRSCGYPFAIIKWGQLGLSAPWANKPVNIAGVTRKDFFYGLFRQLVLCGGTMKKGLMEKKDTNGVLSYISKDKNTIAFCAFTRNTVNAKAIPISSSEGSTYFPPTDKNILSGKYPLSTTVYMLVRLQRDTSLPEWQKIFIKKALSEEGQKRLSGYAIVPAYPKGLKNGLNHYLGKDSQEDKKG